MTQNIIMVNQSAEQVTIPGGTVIGTAIALDHPNAPQLICDMEYAHEGKETGDEEQHSQHVYQLKCAPA